MNRWRCMAKSGFRKGLGCKSPLRFYRFSRNESSRNISSSSLGWKSLPLKVHEDVRKAVSEGRAVVALESTIISHGMPYPQNLEMARDVEGIVRSYGVTPATIAIIRGQICIGLTDEDLLHLSKAGKNAVKCSRRDLPLAVANELDGATTVAGTMFLANLAGIKVFVTGGIGGVHRGAEATMDVSADLTELGKTPVAVVCAGVKSILDIGKTLEFLETQGVPVVSYGTNDFPAFFSPNSGLKSPGGKVDSPLVCAKMIKAAEGLNMETGMVIAVPNPDPSEGEMIEKAILEALQAAEFLGVKGRDITPFLLSEVNKKTKGASLKSNISLVKNNAHVGSKIALALSQLTTPSALHNYNDHSIKTTQRTSQNHVYEAVVIGGSVIDVIGKPHLGSKLLMGTSNPGVLEQHYGGVGRNICEALARLGVSPYFVSAVGGDIQGQGLLNSMQNDLNLNLEGVHTIPNSRTPSYLAIMDEKGDLSTAIADMDAFRHITTEWVDNHKEKIIEAKVVICDGNLLPETFRRVGKLCMQYKVPLFFEPTSVAKSTLPIIANCYNAITFLKPNIDELLEISARLNIKNMKLKESGRESYNQLLSERLYSLLSKVNAAADENDSTNAKAVDQFVSAIQEPVKTVFQALWDNEVDTSNPSTKLTDGVPWIDQQKHIIISLGTKGVLLASAKREGDENITFKRVPAQLSENVRNVTGAGDSLAGGFVYGLLEGNSAELSVRMGTVAAKYSVEAIEAISPRLTPELLTRVL